MLQLNAMAEGRDWQISEVCPYVQIFEGFSSCFVLFFWRVWMTKFIGHFEAVSCVWRLYSSW